MKSGFQVLAIAQDLDFLLWDLVEVAILKFTLIDIAPEQIIYLKSQKSSKKVFVNFVQAQGAPGFQNTLGDLREVRRNELRQEMESEHVINPLTIDLLAN